MDKKRTPNQAMADTMAAWQMPDAEADRMERIRKLERERIADRVNRKIDQLKAEGKR